MMYKAILSIFLILTFESIHAQILKIDENNRANLPGKDSSLQIEVHQGELHIISMIELIANPEKYHGKVVSISGFLNLQFEGSAVYLRKEDYEYGMNENGCWVEFADKVKPDQPASASGKYVNITGIYDMKSGGHFGLWSGTIKEINMLYILEKRKEND